MNIIKSLFAFLVMLVATLLTASHAQAFALGNHAGGFFLGTLDCAGLNGLGTRNLSRENGWLNYDTLSGCSVATNKADVKKHILDNVPAKVNPKNSKTLQEGNVTLDLGGGTKVNLRVETHPLKPGGPPVNHANVEVMKTTSRGKNKVVKNIHITE